jgi:hypothetical protein
MNLILHSEPISWIIHFLIFVVLARFSGIKWQWAIMLVLGIEVWEMLDWSLNNPMYWWSKFDTWADIVVGLIGIWIGTKLKGSIWEA